MDDLFVFFFYILFPIGPPFGVWNVPVLRFPDHVVMIVVSADEAAAYLNKYKLFREGPDRRVLAVRSMSVGNVNVAYRCCKVGAVEG